MEKLLDFFSHPGYSPIKRTVGCLWPGVEPVGDGRRDTDAYATLDEALERQG